MLQLAVSNKDTNMLIDLYSANFAGTWGPDSFIRLFLMIEGEEWIEGRKILFESITTEIMYKSLSVS